MPPLRSDIWTHFDDCLSGNRKLRRAKCHYCSYELIGQANRLRTHLASCVRYGIYKSTLKGSESLPLEEFVHHCSPMEQKAHDQRLGMAIFAGGLPFHTFDKSNNLPMWEFVHELNPAYKIPERHRIADELLPQCYTNIQAKVQKILDTVQYLNFTLDESDDTAKRRICNLSVNIPTQGTFFLKNYHTGSYNQSAAYLAELVTPGITAACESDYLRVNSIATDTCSTMRSLHTKMAEMPQFSHVLFVLCDSHSIQLLFKAIFNVPYYKMILHKAQSLVAAFSHSRLQLAILRDYQLTKYNKTYALIIAIITRWGTQYGIFQSLLRSREALRTYAVDDRAKLIYNKVDITHWLLDAALWGEFEAMQELLTPIHEAQKASESNDSHIGLVTRRWLSMRASLSHLYSTRRFPHLESIINPQGDFARLYNQQTTTIHWVAYYLDPASVGLPVHVTINDSMLDFIRQYTDLDKDESLWAKISSDFFAFRNRQHQWNPHVRGDIWSAILIAKPTLFWQLNQHRAPELAAFALRIFNTPANSVPSERAFSAMNYVLHKNRTKLSTERTDQSIYIYMNTRTLRTSYKMESGPSMTSLTPDDALNLEDEVLNVMDGNEILEMIEEATGTGQAEQAELTMTENHTENQAVAMSQYPISDSYHTYYS